ncbi:MAG: outer membrane protein assembly factor [Gammaproteobacteria bacterium]|nr:outer membrane protein assembly factor [Gammaproteobacteria bacterium]
MKRAILLLFMLLPALPAHSEVTLKVNGGDAVLVENLRARLSLQTEPCDAPEWRVQLLFKRAEEEFQPAFRALGYYQAKVEKSLQSGGECWHADFSIDPGERVTIRERTVTVRGEASSDKQLQPLLSALPLVKGDPLDHGLYEEIKTRLQDFAVERGYFDFKLTRKQLRIDPDEAKADIEIEAESGARYRFGELRLSEQPLNENFIRRLARISEGDPYDARALTNIDRQLSDAGYFQRVEVTPRRDEASDGRVPIDLLMEPAPRHAWRAGVGYATDTGPRMSLGYDNRYINPKGHRFESEMRLSQIEPGLTADYIFPGEDPHREEFSLGARLLHEESESVYSNSATLVGKQTLKSERWTQTRFVELLYEQSEVGDDSTTATLLMPGITLERIKADNPLRTRKGYRMSMEARAAYEGVISTSTFLQLRASAKGIYRFGEGGRLVARVDLGATLGENIGDLPASLRFFAGGDNSVRGYEYKSLGPVDSAGEAKGGRHLLTSTLAYEHPIVKDDWWLAAFVDSGNAFDDSEFDIKTGYGAGVRWYSPIGRLRLDLAFPSDTEKDDWRIHFGLGADL